MVQTTNSLNVCWWWWLNNVTSAFSISMFIIREIWKLKTTRWYSYSKWKIVEVIFYSKTHIYFMVRVSRGSESDEREGLCSCAVYMNYVISWDIIFLYPRAILNQAYAFTCFLKWKRSLKAFITVFTRMREKNKIYWEKFKRKI